MPGYIGQVYPQAPVAPDSVNEVALNVPELQAAGLMPTAWCVFDGTLTGTNAPIAGYNVVSVTRLGIGSYTINFATAMDIVTYDIQANIQRRTIDSNQYGMNTVDKDVDPTINGFTIRCSNQTGVDADTARVYITIFGGKN